jgi:CubicO group peptidase (beta-lactamase class C family)
MSRKVRWKYLLEGASLATVPNLWLICGINELEPTMLHVLALILLLHPQAPAGKLTAAQSAAVDAAVKAQMEKQGLVGVAVGILQKGEIVYLKGYGLSDREKKTPVTTATIFNWASNSKPLCGVLAMQLVEQKKLDLDADIRRYLPEFPEKSGVITMRHLLCHQSGIQHYGRPIPTKRTYTSAMPNMDPVLAMDVFNQSPLLHPPGSKELYSSYAYIVASAVVQKAGGEHYSRQLEKRIAKPLGLASLQYDVPSEGQPHWAMGYTKMAGAVVQTKEEAHYWKHGAGGFKSNIVDFARWAKGLLQHKLVSPGTENTMWTRQTVKEGKASYGLGFAVDDHNGLRVSHNGKQGEATSRMVLYPRSGDGIVVMTNCGHGDPSAITTAMFAALGTK